MKTVLFAWELGGGLGHVMTLRRLASRLRHLGIGAVFAIKDSRAAGPLQAGGIEVIQAPLWPSASMSAAEVARTSSATMGDILCTAGLANPDKLDSLLDAWSAEFARIKPDIVVADLAPAASLAARGRVPLIVIGNGFTLPPSTMTRFPALHDLSPPVWPEEQVLETINAILRKRGQVVLDHLPQIFSGDEQLVLSFPMFDPYRAQRETTVAGPIFDQPPRDFGSAKDSIYVYLSRGYPIPADLPAALMPHARRLRIHAPMLAAGHRTGLADAGARIETDPLPLAEVLPSSRLVIHFGGSGVACEALACGVPQMILSNHIEQDFNGSVLERAGLGLHVKAYDPSAAIDAGMIEALVNDTALAERAYRAGIEHRASLQRSDALSAFEQASIALLEH
jgi:UDP:flavonoid glycosyltransferase YjiC (YdhE family)